MKLNWKESKRVSGWVGERVGGKSRRPTHLLTYPLTVLIVMAIAGLTIIPQTRADLTARVYPGYIFSAGERPDISKLNRLGAPTIVIVGTLDGTNVGLSAGSVNLTMLSSDIYDNVTIDATNGTSLRVKPGGIRLLQLYTNIFDTSSAMEPTATTLRWNPDWNFLAISNNQATMRTSIVTTAVSDGLRTSTHTYSNQVAVPSAASAASVAHGMGTTPSWWRASMVCTNADLNYAAGDEVDLGSFTVFGQFGDSEVSGPAFVAYIDPAGTPAIVVRRCASTVSSISVSTYTLNKTTGAFEAITASSWNLRLRVRK